jgi:polysaccharide biosynthesis transport protein
MMNSTSSGSLDPSRDVPRTSELREYLIGLWLRKWSILLVSVVVVAGALWYSSRQGPIYVSTAEDLVQPANLSPTEPLSAQVYVDVLTEQRVASSGQVARIAQEKLDELGLEMGGISVEPSGETTRTLIFTASSPHPRVAKETAQAFAEAYLQYRREQVLEDLRAAREPLIQRRAQLERMLANIRKHIARTNDESKRASLQVRFNSLFTQRSLLEQKLNALTLPEDLHVGAVLQGASFPTAPSNSYFKIGALGLFAGLSLGVVLAFVRDRFDRRLRGKRDLEARTGAPVLASIPQQKGKHLDLVTMTDRGSKVASAYRELGANLLLAASQRGVKSILVTSCQNGDGKAVTAANLSTTLAEAGKRVVLICADLNEDGAGSYFPTTPDNPYDPALAGADSDSTGGDFMDLVSGHAGVLDALSHSQFIMENLHVIGGGNSANGHVLLHEQGVREILSRLVQIADFVLIDGGPILNAPDARILASAVDGVLLVADSERADRAAILEARRQFELINCRVIGSVLHAGNQRRLSYYDDTIGPFGPA